MKRVGAPRKLSPDAEAAMSIEFATGSTWQVVGPILMENA